MLEKYIPLLIKELELGDTNLASGVPGVYALPLEEGLAINISEIGQGVQFTSNIAPFPKANQEMFATRAMFGNLFGQGTHDAVLGLTADGNTLTLTRAIEYNIDYKEFRENLEDFITVVDLWREEALTHK